MNDKNFEAINLINEKSLDAIRGSLIGGAAGDALGYPVEFMAYNTICRRFGENGIAEYCLNKETGNAVISDDTQMTLFTANGILFGATRAALRGIGGPVESYVYMAYLDWYATQAGKSFENKNNISWLTAIGELHARRAPGNTCMGALGSGKMGEIEKPLNDSKGCGGVMRVAPVALYFKQPRPLEGAKIAAVTHGHPLGYMPAAALVQIIGRIVYGGCPSGDTLNDITDECCVILKDLFSGNEYLTELLDIIKSAQTLSQNCDSDEKNIARIGQGWVAEEALGISLYCSLKYYDDFSKAIIAAVNHSGDSDSTGAITGNIVGAHIGYDKIPDKWKKNLELRDIILEVADDICHGCQIDAYSSYVDKEWLEKYGGANSFYIN